MCTHGDGFLLPVDHAGVARSWSFWCIWEGLAEWEEEILTRKVDYDVFLNREYCSLGVMEGFFTMFKVISSASGQVDPLIHVDQTLNHVDVRWVSLPAKCAISGQWNGVSVPTLDSEKTRKTCLVVAKCFSEAAVKIVGTVKLWEVYGLCISLLPPLPVVLPHMAAASRGKVLYFLLAGLFPRSCSIYHAYISQEGYLHICMLSHPLLICKAIIQKCVYWQRNGC